VQATSNAFEGNGRFRLSGICPLALAVLRRPVIYSRESVKSTDRSAADNRSATG